VDQEVEDLAVLGIKLLELPELLILVVAVGLVRKDHIQPVRLADQV